MTRNIERWVAGPRLGRKHRLPENVHTVGAVWSPCGRYRYALWRVWGEPGDPIAAFIGMNPSSADAHHDDATVQRCRGFAWRWSYAGLLMLNAWGIRGTDPEEALAEGQDPIGADNDDLIARHADRGILALSESTEAPIGLWVAAWGNQGARQGRGEAVAGIVAQSRYVYCLGRTKSGHPRHPSRIGYDTALELFKRGGRGAGGIGHACTQ